MSRSSRRTETTATMPPARKTRIKRRVDDKTHLPGVDESRPSEKDLRRPVFQPDPEIFEFGGALSRNLAMSWTCGSRSALRNS
jgi:hypothetical protein